MITCYFKFNLLESSTFSALLFICISYSVFFGSLKHQWKPIWPNPWSHHPDSSSITTCHNRRREVVLCWVWERMWITELDRNTPWSQQTSRGILGFASTKKHNKKKAAFIGKRNKTHQSQKQLEQEWEPTGLVLRCRGQSPGDHRRIHWWRWLLRREKKGTCLLLVKLRGTRRNILNIMHPVVICFTTPVLAPQMNTARWTVNAN